MVLLAHKAATLKEHDFSDGIVGADPASIVGTKILVSMARPKSRGKQRDTTTGKSQLPFDAEVRRRKKDLTIEKVLDRVDLQYLFLPHEGDHASTH